LERVLSESPRSPLRAQERLFALHGVRLEVPPDARGALVDRALAHGLGARALHRVVFEAFAELEFRLSGLAEKGVGAVRMTRAAIEGRGSPVFVARRAMPDWAEPFPSAAQLCLGALGGHARAETSPPKREPRAQPSRRPRPAGDSPTLFEPEG
jgi:hypothetical protein